MNINTVLDIYLISVNTAAVLFTAADKYKAVKGKYRISEDLLLTLAFFGGAASEYVMMLFIRHKTNHKRFMLGLPAMILMHIALAILVSYISKL